MALKNSAQESNNKPENAVLDDASVSAYLTQHRDFLQRNPELMDHLEIPHASGSATSLVEKQVGILRERNIGMRRRIANFTDNARDNDKIYQQTRELVLALLEAPTTQALCQTFSTAMTADFDVEHASIIIFGEQAGSDTTYRLETRESAHMQIGALLGNRKNQCGALRPDELGYLFPQAGDVGSAAVIPLGNDNQELGLIALGSSDASRYDSAMGTLFLSHVADVISRLLPRLEQH
jgi:uncharacterized protein YigA (DUF484 family)